MHCDEDHRECPEQRSIVNRCRSMVAAALLLGAGAFLGMRGAPAQSAADDAKSAANRGADDHWAFRPLTEPVIPMPRNAHGHATTIDHFVHAKLEDAGLTPMPAAGRATLCRRVTFDLTGLPPTPEQIDAFLNDTEPDACEKMIDRLLASPAYGERWAQHWLDIARFAETDGFEHDLVRPNAWRYRDWVIDALNSDMPFDEFVRLQIAGDEFAHMRQSPATRNEQPEQESESAIGIGAVSTRATHSIATGFLLCGPDMPDINLQDERRHTVLNEMTATVGSVFLGLQLGCAQCHDHKFDPITMADFYRLRAFFEPADFFDEAPIASPREIAERERIEAPIKADRERIDKELKKFDAIAHERLNKDPQVKISRDELLSALSETEREEFRRHLEEQKELAEKNKLAPLPMGRVLREKGGVPRPSHIMLRGDFRQPGPRVTPAFPAIANRWNATVEIPESAAPSSGRRAALAAWLTRPDHPLTTRVIVNRIWQYHFGHGLVRSPSDFGTTSEPPSHPALLDWLAAGFARPAKSSPAASAAAPDSTRTAAEQPQHDQEGLAWSLKRLHKVILMSATYQQASRPSDPEWTENQRAAAIASWNRSREADPQNRWLARMNRLRLDGESIRDAMLASSDRLSARRGGPGVRPPLPDELVATLLKNQWVTSPEEEDHRRRSIYIFMRRNLRYPLFDVFDRPDSNASCPQRPRSTTAPQSLMLLNSQFSFDAARELAATVRRIAGESTQAQIRLCYLRTLGRDPSSEELATASRFLSNQIDQSPTRSESAPQVALTQLCLAIFNLNEFIYLD